MIPPLEVSGFSIFVEISGLGISGFILIFFFFELLQEDDEDFFLRLILLHP
jgi:hypothetical protein